MTILTNRVNNNIVYIGTKTGETLAGYLIMDEFEVFVPKFVYLYTKDEIPQEVLDKPEKYCYTEEKGFYDWVEPVNPEVEAIKQEYRDELAQEVSQNVYDA